MLWAVAGKHFRNLRVVLLGGTKSCDGYRTITLGRTRRGGGTLERGIFLPSKCLFDSLFRALLSTPSKNPSQNLRPTARHQLRTLLESSLENLLRTLLRRARCRMTPLGVHPIGAVRSEMKGCWATL